MSLDMADRMVVVGISAKSMTARAETDCKSEHLAPASSSDPGDGNKAKAPLPARLPTVPVALARKPDSGTLALPERCSLVQLPLPLRHY